MNLEERINSIPGGRWVVSTLVFFLLEGVYHFFDFVEKVPNACLWILLQIVEPEQARTVRLEPGTLGRFVVLAAYTLVVLLICAAIFFHATWRRKMEARYAKRHGSQISRQATEIYRWLASRTDLPFVESQVRRDLTIKKNYDVEYVERTTFRADQTSSLYAVAFEIISDERLKDNEKCEFKVKSLTPGVSVICLPAEESLVRSRHVVLVVPPVGPDHGGAMIEVRMRWPKAANKLAKFGVADAQTYRVKKRIRTPIDQVVMSVTVELEGEFGFAAEIDPSDCTSSKTSSTGPKHYALVAENMQPKGEMAIMVTRETPTQPSSGD